MTAGMIVGLILMPFALMLMFAVNKSHREETGVNAPTRDAMRRIRRNARKKGISEAEAYNQWLNRKTSKFRKNPAAYDFSYAADTRQRSKNHHFRDTNAPIYKKPQARDDVLDDLLMKMATTRNESLPAGEWQVLHPESESFAGRLRHLP